MPESRALAAALEAMRDGAWSSALTLAEEAGPEARDLVEWHRLREGRGTREDVRSFLARRPDWPGLRLLLRRSEAALEGRAEPEEIVAFFEATPPQTGRGSVTLSTAYERLGRSGDAEAQAVLAWVSQALSASDEARLLRVYGSLLADHHEDRLDMLLWRGEEAQARRMFDRVGSDWRALGEARLGLRHNRSGVDALIKAVPDNLADHPGLAFERFQWRARKGMNAGAVEILADRQGNAAALGEPSYWANWRRILARWSMRQGDTKTAYALAANHGLEGGSNYADLEWLAGYIALTHHEDAKTALVHFRQFRNAVSTPISLGRAGYWEGRALETLDEPLAARAAYALGGQFQTSFYGQLAAEKAGLPMDPTLTGAHSFPPHEAAPYRKSSVFRIAEHLLDIEERQLAERFFIHLAEGLNAEGVGSLSRYLLGVDEPHVALMVAKSAAGDGIVLPRAYFPIVDLGVDNMPVSDALALSIARRESEFDPGAMSGVGARGLMQIMPATAREVAGKIGLSYSRDRLVKDPVYNARIGTAYLDELLERFDQDILLVAAAYNAGPSRPERWMRERGDPRRPEIDAIDWIEHIPFRETRNYAMRVLESVTVYEARLAGETGPIGLTERLGGVVSPPTASRATQ
ncbi:MAG: lytic transglycosylase domain-containing protein [Pseudomonadota bacterium]